MVKPQCLEVFRGAGCSGVGDPFRERWKLEELGVGGMQGSCKSGWVSFEFQGSTPRRKKCSLPLLLTLPKRP